MANPYVETRIRFTRVMLIAVAVLESALFTWGALAVPEPGWFVALPVNALAVALVVVGSRRRISTEGESGTGLTALGGLLVAAAIFVSFAVGNAT